MNALLKSVAKFFVFGLSILIIGWTGWHSYSVLYAATKDPVSSVYGLLCFEGGMITWFLVFQKNAESIGQHVVSLFGTIIGVLFVCIAFFLSIQVSAEEIAQYGSTGRWLIVAATIETLVFVLLYEMFSPKVWEEFMEMVHVATLQDKAEKKAQQMIERDSDSLADEIARNRKERAFANARLTGIKQVPQVSGQKQQMPPRPAVAMGMDVGTPPVPGKGDKPPFEG